jgi:hypothetical protein
LDNTKNGITANNEIINSWDINNTEMTDKNTIVLYLKTLNNQKRKKEIKVRENKSKRK